LQRLSLTEKAYREIRRGITQHLIKPGSLMTTRELAALLNMSQTPIREALCILEHEHFVVRMPKRGYAVKVMDVKEFVDIYDMRLAIEVLAVELAARKIKDAEIARLEKLLDDTGKKKPRVNIMEAEQEFHSIILESSDNPLLEQTGKRILDRIWMVQKIVLHNSKHWSESNCDHKKIFNEIKSGHKERASEIMKRHLNWGRQLVLSRLEDGDDFLSTLFCQP
jgi:DNA-binding GntR family transcriptional regulator